jgi:hypothetical protein
LHPAVHGALLARRDIPEHMAALDEHRIQPIDLVAVNLYPFRETVARKNVTPENTGKAAATSEGGGPDFGQVLSQARTKQPQKAEAKEQVKEPAKPSSAKKEKPDNPQGTDPSVQDAAASANTAPPCSSATDQHSDDVEPEKNAPESTSEAPPEATPAQTIVAAIVNTTTPQPTVENVQAVQAAARHHRPRDA